MIFNALWLLFLCCTVDLMITDSQKCEWKIMRTEGIEKKREKNWLYFNLKPQNSFDLQNFLFPSNLARKQSAFFNKVANLYPVALLKKNSGAGVFKNTFFMEHLRATSLICKQLFNLPHRVLKRNQYLNMLSTLSLSFLVKIAYKYFLKCNNFLNSLIFLGQILATSGF